MAFDFSVNVSQDILETKLKEAFQPHRPDASPGVCGSRGDFNRCHNSARKGTDIIIVGVFATKPGCGHRTGSRQRTTVINTSLYKEKDYRTAIDLIQRQQGAHPAPISKHFAFHDYPQAYKYIEAYPG